MRNQKNIKSKVKKKTQAKTEYSGDHSAVVLPESIPNSEVKCRNADGSVGIPHVRVGHRQIELQAKAKRTPQQQYCGVLLFSLSVNCKKFSKYYRFLYISSRSSFLLLVQKTIYFHFSILKSLDIDISKETSRLKFNFS